MNFMSRTSAKYPAGIHIYLIAAALFSDGLLVGIWRTDRVTLFVVWAYCLFGLGIAQLQPHAQTILP